MAPHTPARLAERYGAKDAAEILAESAARGRELARLLDTDAPVPGVTQAPLQIGRWPP